MSYNLFLDDWKSPKDCRNYPGDGTVYDVSEFVIVKSFTEFYQIIKERGIPKFVSFDYQIDGDATGLDCAEFLKFECNEQGVDFPVYNVHSSWPGIKGEFLNIIDN